VLAFNQDARKLFNTLLGSAELQARDLRFRHFDHIFMNLPVDAIEFLDVLRGLLTKSDKTIWTEQTLPLVHVYGFVVGEDEVECKEKLVARVQA